jgi:hypothetical protein
VAHPAKAVGYVRNLSVVQFPGIGAGTKHTLLALVVSTGSDLIKKAALLPVMLGVYPVCRFQASAK